MKRFRAIVSSKVEPEDKEVLWLHRGVLLYYYNGGWTSVITPVHILDKDKEILKEVVQEDLDALSSRIDYIKEDVELDYNDLQKLKKEVEGALNSVEKHDLFFKEVYSSLDSHSYRINSLENTVNNLKISIDDVGYKLDESIEHVQEVENKAHEAMVLASHLQSAVSRNEDTIQNLELVYEALEEDLRREERNREANCDAISDRLSLQVLNIGVYPIHGIEDDVTSVSDYSEGSIVYNKANNLFVILEQGLWNACGDDYNSNLDTPVALEDRIFRLNNSFYKVGYDIQGNKNMLLFTDTYTVYKLLNNKQDRLYFGDEFILGEGNELSLSSKVEELRFAEIFKSRATVGTLEYANYDPDTRQFELYGYTFNYLKAIKYYIASSALTALGPNQEVWQNDGLVDLFLPIICNNLTLTTGQCFSTKALCFTNNLLSGFVDVNTLDLSNCQSLQSILGRPLRLSSLSRVSFYNCLRLVDIKLYGLQKDLSLKQSSGISLLSLEYMVNNSAASTANPISITVHDIVFAKLMGDTTNSAVLHIPTIVLAQWEALVDLAASKHITFTH